MNSRPTRRVVWVYDRDHRSHPFIRIALETLAAANMDVTIINSAPAPPQASYQALPSLDVTDPDGRLIRFVSRWYSEIYAKTKHLACIEQGRPDGGRFRRTLLGVRHRTAGLVQRALPFAYPIVKSVLRTARAAVRTPLAYVTAGIHLLARAPDVVVATRPSAALLGFVCARMRGCRFVYYPFELYGNQTASYSRVVAWAERVMLWLGVDALITQNEARLSVYRDERRHRGPGYIVHNYRRYCDVQPSGLLRPRLGLPDDVRIVLYEGLLIEGRWLEELVAAAAWLPSDTRLVLMGAPKGSWWKVHALPRLSADGHLRPDRVLLADFVAYDDLLALVADADAGIIIYDRSARNNVLCAPGKLSDYVFAGVPVVAPRFPTIAPLIESLDIGVCFDDGAPKQIAEAIEQVLRRGRADYAPSLRRARQLLCWENEAPALVQAVTAEERELRGASPRASRPELLQPSGSFSARPDT